MSRARRGVPTAAARWRPSRRPPATRRFRGDSSVAVRPSRSVACVFRRPASLSAVEGHARRRYDPRACPGTSQRPRSLGIGRANWQYRAAPRGRRRFTDWLGPVIHRQEAPMSRRLVDDLVAPELDRSLESAFAALLVRHKEAAAKTGWAYREFVPRGSANDRSPLSPTAYLAVETALLTEVNLPWYTAGLARGLESCPGPIQELLRVWTSEEDQHATLLESYLLFTGSGDLSARGRSRKAMIAAGWTHSLGGPFEGMVYTAMQEAATRTFYLCVARACGEQHPPLAAALRRIAKDETLHMAFYR